MTWKGRRYLVGLITITAGLLLCFAYWNFMASLAGFGIGVAVTLMAATWATED